MILLIDNYDSFVYNLAHYVERLGVACRVARNDALSIANIQSMQPTGIILSPGPCAPQQAGISIDVVRQLGSSIPILGVCLGHQAIGEAYGASTTRANTPVHGKASIIEHDGSGVFTNLPSPLTVGRYHSLIVAFGEKSSLKITARSSEGEIMAMQHNSHPVYGVQFHPESILTPQGLDIMQNFLTIAQNWRQRKQDAA